jgi:hypothetical protein
MQTNERRKYSRTGFGYKGTFASFIAASIITDPAIIEELDSVFGNVRSIGGTINGASDYRASLMGDSQAKLVFRNSGNYCLYGALSDAAREAFGMALVEYFKQHTELSTLYLQIDQGATLMVEMPVTKAPDSNDYVFGKNIVFAKRGGEEGGEATAASNAGDAQPNKPPA